MKKKIKNSAILDGDQIRKLISYDLGYSVKDRKIQIHRIYGIIKILLSSKIFPIACTVYMNNSLRKKLKKEKICLIYISRNLKIIKNRKNIYNNNTKNVVGIDIKAPKLKSDFSIENDSSMINFHKKLKRITNAR